MPPELPTPDDWLTARSSETRLMAAARKRQLAAEGLMPASELLALDRLEAKLASRERVERVKAMTRRG